MNIRSPHDLAGRPGLLHHSFAFIGGGGSSAAPQRNFTTEQLQTLAGEQQTAPGFLALNQQYQLPYGQIDLQKQAQQQNGFYNPDGSYQPGTVALGQQANTSNRGAALGDLNSFGGAGTNALLGTNPYLANALGLQNYAAQAASSPSDILNQLNAQANSQLAQNGRLTAGQNRDLSQQALASFAANGTAHGNSAIASDILSRSAATTQRQQQAQQFASGVQGLNQQQQSLAGSLAGNAANTASQTLTNPILQLLGLGNLNPGYNGTGSSSSSGIASANDLFPTQSSYLSDLFSSNQNATASNNIAAGNNSAATTSAVLGLVGSLFSDERLKKRIKPTGTTTPQGIPEKEFEYRTDPRKRRFVGVMAQDVEKVAPWAVQTDPVSGVKAVNYGALGISMHEMLTS